jgi:hypothetical protein
MNQNKIEGISMVAAGIMGFLAFVWDWMLYQAMEDIAFGIAFVAIIAVGVYILRLKKVAEIDRSSQYASSY